MSILMLCIFWFIFVFIITLLTGVKGLILCGIFTFVFIFGGSEIVNASIPDEIEKDRQELKRDQEIANQYIEIDYLDNFDD